MSRRSADETKQGIRNLNGRRALAPSNGVPVPVVDPGAPTERRPGETFDDRPILDELAARRVETPILKHFRFGHLKPESRAISRRFAELALFIVKSTPRDPEQTVALRKLLESKDAAVRAGLPD